MKTQVFSWEPVRGKRRLLTLTRPEYTEKPHEYQHATKTKNNTTIKSKQNLASA